jgi:hypothetical protein
MVPWISDNSINMFITYCISIHTTVILFVFSMVLPAGKFHQIGTGADELFSIIRSALLVFIVFTLVFAFLTELVQPGIYKRKQAIIQKTEMMSSFKTQAHDYYKDGNFEEAQRFIDYYLRFDKNNTEMERMLRNVHERNRIGEDNDPTGTEQSVSRNMDRSPAELLKTAGIYFEQEDYLSAHYYAILAHSIDSTREEAKNLADRAWEELKKAGIDARSREETLLYSRKQEAYTVLKQGDPVRAYYLFLSLINQYPQDPDIKKYFRESLETVEKAAFFKQEVEVLESIPGFKNIFFVNKREKELIEFVSIPHLVPKEGTLYVEDIEVLGVTADSGAPADGSNELLYHYRAPYGKLQNGEILLRCIEKDRERVHYPVSLMEEEEEKEVPFSLTLGPPVEMLRYLTPSNTGKEMNIAVLWDGTELFSQYGYPREPLQQEFFYRIVRIFTFFIASLFACYLGWTLRVVGKGAPLIPVLFIPLFPLALSRLFSLYFWLVSTLVGFVLVLSGFFLALLFLIATQAVIMFSIILLFARRYYKRP